VSGLECARRPALFEALGEAGGGEGGPGAEVPLLGGCGAARRGAARHGTT
jgi:hypothetical protein